MVVFYSIVSTVVEMNADRYIPDRPFRECDSANFWVNNRTTDEKLEDYLRSTRLNQQVFDNSVVKIYYQFFIHLAP